MNFCLFLDPEDEEYQKNLRRPADVKEDMKQMEDRSRVSLILNSEAFRRELEDIIDEQIRQGNHPASLLALQQISNLLVPNAKFSQQGTLFRGSRYHITMEYNCLNSPDFKSHCPFYSRQDKHSASSAFH